MMDKIKAQCSHQIGPAPRATAHGDSKAHSTQLGDSGQSLEDRGLTCWQSPGNINRQIDAWNTIAARAMQLI